MGKPWRERGKWMRENLEGVRKDNYRLKSKKRLWDLSTLTTATPCFPFISNKYMAGAGNTGVTLGRKDEGLREQKWGQCASSGLVQSHPTDALWGFPAAPKAGAGLLGFIQFFCGSGAAADTGKIPIPSKVWKRGYNLPSSPVPPALRCSEPLRAAAAPKGRMAKG